MINSQYDLDASYLSCVSSLMSTHRPFGDIPEELSVSVGRAVGAARAVGNALVAAQKIAEDMVKVGDIRLRLFFYVIDLTNYSGSGGLGFLGLFINISLKSGYGVAKLLHGL